MNARTDSPHPQPATAAELRRDTDARAVQAEKEPVQGGEAAGAGVEVCTNCEQRYREFEERIKELEYLFGLLLEDSHDLVNDLQAAKSRWNAKRLPVWKAHIEKKRKLVGNV